MTASEASRQKLPRRPLSARLRERFRFGLLTHDLLIRVHRRTGFCIYPYTIYFAKWGISDKENAPVNELTSRLEIRALATCDPGVVAEISALRGVEPTQLLARSEDRLKGEIWIVALVDGNLAGYYWASTAACVHPITHAPFFRLEANEAYLAYTYVAPEYRGSRIGRALSEAIRAALAAEGRDRHYWIISPLNTSSRRHSARARTNVRILEHRVLLGVPKFAALDVRVRTERGGMKTPLARAYWYPRRSAGVSAADLSTTR